MAAKAARGAEATRRDFSSVPVPSPGAAARLCSGVSTAQLYDYFEQCFVSAIFAYQAVEAYCNFKIAYTLQGELLIRRKKGESLLPREQIERLPVEEKLDLVLPILLKRGSPKGSVTWQHFRELEDLRDATVHLKSHHQWTGHGDFENSPYAAFVRRGPTFCVAAAMSVISYFAGSHEESWLAGTKALLHGIDPLSGRGDR